MTVGGAVVEGSDALASPTAGGVVVDTPAPGARSPSQPGDDDAAAALRAALAQALTRQQSPATLAVDGTAAAAGGVPNAGAGLSEGDRSMPRPRCRAASPSSSRSSVSIASGRSAAAASTCSSVSLHTSSMRDHAPPRLAAALQVRLSSAAPLAAARNASGPGTALAAGVSRGAAGVQPTPTPLTTPPPCALPVLSASSAAHMLSAAARLAPVRLVARC